jgi:uncharacterized protein (TIGR00369 family)
METRRAGEWPFLAEPPHGRIALQRQMIDSDAFFRLLGVRLVEAQQDRATLALTVRDQLMQPTGILHGGLHALLIDSAIAQALLTTLHPACSVVTVHLDTKYFSPVSQGEVFAAASVVRKGKRIAHGEAVVRSDSGKRIAQGWGVFAITGAPSVER